MAIKLPFWSDLSSTMGSVTSALERTVIDVSWACHEWFYGRSGAACVRPRPLTTTTTPRKRCRHSPRRHHHHHHTRRQHQEQPAPPSSSPTPPAPEPLRLEPLGLGLPVDSEAERLARWFSGHELVTSTPEPGQQRCATPDWDATPIPRLSALPLEEEPASTTETEDDQEATLFRCTAARNGRLPSAKGVENAVEMYVKRLERRHYNLAARAPVLRRMAGLRI